LTQALTTLPSGTVEVCAMKTLHALKFLAMGPVILVILFFINLMTSPGHWWVQWAALGIGIAWVISLMRVLFAIVVMGGLAAFAAFVMKQRG
jgi:hypothetical protein